MKQDNPEKSSFQQGMESLFNVRGKVSAGNAPEKNGASQFVEELRYD